MQYKDTKQTIIKGIFVYFFLALGIIFTIIGLYMSIQTVISFTQNPYPLETYRETSCEYITTPAVAGADAKSNAQLLLDQQNQYKSCKDNLEKERISKKRSDVVNSIFFLVVGTSLSSIFSKKSKEL